MRLRRREETSKLPPFPCERAAPRLRFTIIARAFNEQFRERYIRAYIALLLHRISQSRFTIFRISAPSRRLTSNVYRKALKGSWRYGELVRCVTRLSSSSSSSFPQPLSSFLLFFYNDKSFIYDDVIRWCVHNLVLRTLARQMHALPISHDHDPHHHHHHNPDQARGQQTYLRSRI